MKQDYVICKGKKYNSGDTMDILWYTCGYKNIRDYKGIFIDCDEEKNEYRFAVDGKIYCFNKVCFYRIIKDNTTINENENYISSTPKKSAFKDELNIDGMLIAWIWYIFIMAVLIIFNNRILGWISVSIIFFSYRHNKLKQGGNKK